MKYPDLFLSLNLFCLAVGFVAGCLMRWGVTHWPQGPKPLSRAARRVLSGRTR